MEIYEKAWIDDWYPTKKLRDEYYEKGKKSLKEFFAIIKKNPPEPVGLETGFTIKIKDVVIKGRIDRIDKCEDGVEIIDYKTGAAKDKLTTDDKKQLYLYQIAATEALGLKPKKMTFYYLDNNSSLSFLATDAELDKFKQELISQIERIRSSEFTATPGRQCMFCDFREICEFRKL